MKIFEYPIQSAADETCIQMPKGARLLTVHERSGQLMLWALVDESEPMVERRIAIRETGTEIRDTECFDNPRSCLSYVDTAFLGPVVLHVFERGEVVTATAKPPRKEPVVPCTHCGGIGCIQCYAQRHGAPAAPAVPPTDLTLEITLPVDVWASLIAESAEHEDADAIVEAAAAAYVEHLAKGGL